MKNNIVLFKPILTMRKVLDFVEVALLLAIGFTMTTFLPA